MTSLEKSGRKPHPWRRRLLRLGVTVAVLVALLAVAFQVSPRPGSAIIRLAFDRGGDATNDALALLVPDDVVGITNVSYGDEGSDTTLDVWFPESVADTTQTLPTIVWVHGGGWVSGDKSQVANYLKILAGSGYTVIGINYSPAPGATYPTPVRQTNEALAYVRDNAEQLHVDANRIVLAGDSAGAQIAAQVAAITTNPTYAAGMEITPSLQPAQLVGTVLNCGPYVPSMVKDSEGIGGWFVRTVAWAYIGTKDFDAPVMAQADLVRNTTDAFPATWISGGNDDPLTEQGKAFATHLADLGVEVSPLFFADDHQPPLGHEYQFDLTLEDGKRALSETLTFLSTVTSGADPG